MANILTDLAADMYKAADIVGREAIGLIPAVTVNGGSEAVALGDVVRSFVTPSANVNTTVTPSMTIPEGDDQVVINKTMAVSQIANVQIPWSGEDVKHVDNGSGFETVYGDQMKQAFRSIANTIEAHCATVSYQGASRAFGTAGTTPFASNFDEVAEMRQILVDNGMSMNDGQASIVMNTTAGTNLRQLAQLQKINESGSSEFLRQGTLLDLQGFMLKESAQIQSHTKGTGTLYVTSGSTAIGVEDIALITGSGTVLAGDVATFAADTTNKYIVNTGVTAPGTISLGDPGARVVIPTSNALTVGASYTANLAVHRSAVELVVRPLAKPGGGDAAIDEMIIQDPDSGLVFRVSAYKGFYKSMFDITVLYQAKVWNSDGVGVLLG